MILIRPPCSTTNSRPELSPGCSRSRGELKSVTTTCVLTAFRDEELLLLLLLPQLKMKHNPRARPRPKNVNCHRDIVFVLATSLMIVQHAPRVVPLTKV